MTNKFGEIVFDEQDLCDLVMQGREPWLMTGVTVSHEIDIENMIHVVEDPEQLITKLIGLIS